MDKGLNHNEKMILTEIISLHKKDGCYAHNQHFADVFQISIKTVSRAMVNLKSKGYIKQVFTDGRKRILEPKMDNMSLQEGQSVLGQKIESPRTKDKVSQDKGQSVLAEPPSNVVPIRQNPEPTNSSTNSLTNSSLLDTVVSNVPAKKSPPKKPTRRKGPGPETEALKAQYMDLISRWNELTKQDQVFEQRVFGYFCGKVKIHGFEKVHIAMENYAMHPWHQEKRGWKFVQIFTGDGFIGQWATKWPEKELNKYDKASVEFLEYAEKREAKDGL